MAYQDLGLGTTADDGTGDTLRAGGDKINDNFVELYTLLGTGSALSSGISATATIVTLASPTITGVMSFPDGTAGAPSITNTSDTNCGLYFSAADTLSFTAAGTAQFTMADGVVAPVTDSDVDLGTSSLYFKDAYIDSVTTTGAITVSATTEASAVGTAAVTIAGGIGVSKDMWIGDDIVMDSDSAVIKLGDSQEIEVTHVADTGLILKHTATGDGTPIKLTMQTGEQALTVGEQLGVIDFQAPGESSGTDAVLVAAGIEAVAEEEFSTSSNATKLSFKTASTDTAAETMSLSSGGNLNVSGTASAGSFNDNILLNASAAAGTDAGDDLILDASAASTDVGSRIMYEDGSTGNDKFIDSVNETDKVALVEKVRLEAIHGGGILLNQNSGGILYEDATFDVSDIRGRQTIWMPVVGMRGASTNGAADITSVESTALRPDMFVMDFDSSTKEHAQFSIGMPKQWDGAAMTAKFYYTHATAVSTNMIWGIQGVAISDDDSIDVAYGGAAIVTDTLLNTAEDLQVTAETGPFRLAGSPATGDLCFFQVFRDAANALDTTNSTDGRLIGVRLYYDTNALNDE